jgi:PAS domain-containing protein
LAGKALEQTLGRGWAEALHPDDPPQVLAAWDRTTTELTPVELALRDAEVRARQLEATFDAISDGIFVYDNNGNILQTNAASRRLFAFGARPDYPTLPLAERLPLVQTRDAGGNTVPPEQSP